MTVKPYPLKFAPEFKERVWADGRLNVSDSIRRKGLSEKAG